MRIKAFSSAPALLFLLGGCAIHPVPKDVTGVSTYEIVRQIRCETRQAVIESALEYLTSGSDVDPASREIGLRFVGEPDSISKLSPKLFKGQVHDLLNLFWTTGVAYNFNLDMTEVNNVDAELDFLKTISKGIFGFNLNGRFDRQRQNIRTFTITDNFGDLVRKPMDCSGRLVAENYIYPIAGRVGVDEMIHAFVYLSLFGNLAGKKDDTKGPPTLVDALQFTTTISATATPHVEFTSIGRTLSVSHADLAANASRTDKHLVVVGLALEKAAQAQLGLARNELFGRLLTASGNRAELGAATAVDQFLTQRLFSPTINITP
jgi:hypothetical protein